MKSNNENKHICKPTNNFDYIIVIVLYILLAIIIGTLFQ